MKQTLFTVLFLFNSLVLLSAYGARGDEERHYYSNALKIFLTEEFPNDQTMVYYDHKKDILNISLTGSSFELIDYWKFADYMIRKMPMVAYLSGIRKAKNFSHLEGKLGFEKIFLQTPKATYELFGWYKRNY